MYLNRYIYGYLLFIWNFKGCLKNIRCLVLYLNKIIDYVLYIGSLIGENNNRL